MKPADTPTRKFVESYYSSKKIWLAAALAVALIGIVAIRMIW